MKVCYVLSTPGIAGGANRSLVDLIDAIDQSEFESYVIVNAHGTMEEWLNQRGIPCKVIRYYTAIKQENKIKQAVKALINRVAEQRIRRFLIENKIDILHNNSLPTLVGMQAAAKNKTPYICHVRESLSEGLGMEFTNEKKAKKLISGADTVIFISNYIRNIYEQCHGRNSVVVYDGIDMTHYLESKEILHGDTINLIMVGAINPQKGQLDGVKAIKELVESGQKNISLTIVGIDGSWHGSNEYADNVHRFVDENDLNGFVRFTGEISESESLRDIRKKMDITLVCSKAEGLGRTTIEGMLAGTLVVAANRGATPEIIENDVTGLLYDSADGEIGARILQIINDPGKFREMAKHGQKDAENRFSCDDYVKTISDIYRQIVNSGISKR